MYKWKRKEKSEKADNYHFYYHNCLRIRKHMNQDLNSYFLTFTLMSCTYI